MSNAAGWICAPSLIILGLAFALRPAYCLGILNRIFRQPRTTQWAGWTMMCLGVLLLTNHNVWVFGWPVIVTLLGWLLLMEGTVLAGFSSSLSTLWASVFETEEPFLRLAIVLDGVIMTVLGSAILYNLWTTAV